ncbi:TonB-dependent receptor domain-containing protein [Parahaliea mediterranea]|uniref:TonB-dependent receptor n=1 Tax=Parahaliea mediterranea TaxID=651086 RepID=A0A939DJ17_9GAMM|nr:TonB-dependent receptor [Parahaliea mediterranea]MBN7799056.1 TonB-dependent receptor [Parahaliea mediterranea]
MSRNTTPTRRAGGLLAAAVAAATTAVANQALAQENAGAQLEETVVWGTRVSASSVQLQEGTIAIRQADHISDLLRTIPGVDVGGAHSLNQRITIRSMDDKDLRITIDGARQNTYMYHHMGNLQIHSDILQSVDIDVGTNSVVNGGLGGSVRFETKAARELLKDGDQFGARIQGSYADNDSSGYALTGYGQLTETLDVLAYYNHVDRNNYEVGGGKIKGADGGEIPGTDGEVRGLEGELDDVLLKFGLDIGDRQRLELGYESYEDSGDYSYRPDMGLATDIAIGDNLGLPLTYPTEFTRDTYTLNYDLQWGQASHLKAALFHNESSLWRDEAAIKALWPDSPARVEGTATNSGFNALATSSLGSRVTHDLTYGVDIVRYDTEYHPDGRTLSEEDATASALFIEDTIAFGNGLSLIPGLRYDRHDLDSAVVDDSFSEVTGALAAQYQLGDSLLFKLSSTQLFKGPEIGEVFVGAGLYDSPNPGIEAETGYNTEFALAYEAARFGADRFAAGFTVFRTDIEDYIYDYASSPAGGYWKDNVGDMTIDGYEAYIGYDIGGLQALLSVSDAESDLDAADAHADLDGARLDRQQGETVSLNIDYALADWGVTLHWDTLWVDDVAAALDLDGATLDNAKDGYTVSNLSARWTPKALRGLSLTAGVDNLFDEFYASQSSRTGVSFHPRFGKLYLQDYEPGRNIKVTVTYEL